MAKKRSKDNTALSISELEAEKRALYQSGKNPERLKKVKAMLDFIYYGIKDYQK